MGQLRKYKSKPPAAPKTKAPKGKSAAKPKKAAIRPQE